jgi:hypothetical protein
MSYKKRTGHVERGIRYAFIAKPDRAWTTSELMEWTHGLALYQGKGSRRNRQDYCRSIWRAAERLCVRVGRSRTRSGRPVLWRLRHSAED